MKKSELKKIIRECMREKLNEVTLDKTAALKLLKFVKDTKIKTADDEITLSLNDRDKLKAQIGGKLPRGIPGPEQGLRVTQIINFADPSGDYYNDGGDFVSKEKTILPAGKGKTVGDFARAAGIKV